VTATAEDVARWRASGHAYKAIAVRIAEWSAGQQPGTPVPENYYFRITASQPVYKHAKEFLAEQGVLEHADGAYRVAAPSQPVGTAPESRQPAPTPDTHRRLNVTTPPPAASPSAAMTAVACTCGFKDLPDESLLDHMLHVFTPDDATGLDGQVHEEGPLRTCSCGVTTATTAEMDAHFTSAFTPADHIGRDGTRHEATDAD
jgi:hypothetical protein